MLGEERGLSLRSSSDAAFTSGTVRTARRRGGLERTVVLGEEDVLSTDGCAAIPEVRKERRERRTKKRTHVSQSIDDDDSFVSLAVFQTGMEVVECEEDLTNDDANGGQGKGEGRTGFLPFYECRTKEGRDDHAVGFDVVAPVLLRELEGMKDLDASFLTRVRRREFACFVELRTSVACSSPQSFSLLPPRRVVSSVDLEGDDFGGSARVRASKVDFESEERARGDGSVHSVLCLPHARRCSPTPECFVVGRTEFGEEAVPVGVRGRACEDTGSG